MFTSTSRGSRWDWVAMVALLRSLHLFQYFSNVFLYFSTRFKGISVRAVWGSECILLLLLGESLNRNACFVLGRKRGGGEVLFSVSCLLLCMSGCISEWMKRCLYLYIVIYCDASFQTKSQSFSLCTFHFLTQIHPDVNVSGMYWYVDSVDSFRCFDGWHLACLAYKETFMSFKWKLTQKWPHPNAIPNLLLKNFYSFIFMKVL